MGQQASNNNQFTGRSYPLNLKNEIWNKRIQHQGILKLRGVPFKNCIEINSETTPLFLENIDITLKDLLDTRLYTNKLFPKEDIERLIENLTYTLAFLQQNGIPYKDVHVENVYYDDEIFKILPNELIPAYTYVKFLANNKKDTLQKQFVPLSPQMIIAFRCKQSEIVDMEILDKGNVFCLGLLLLEVATLLPSFQCYDRDALEILDEVVSERIQMVREYYSQEIASIIANMLDYDYIERMGLREISIFVNREINKDKPKQLPRTPKKLIQNNQNMESKMTLYQPKNSSITKSRVSNLNNDNNDDNNDSRIHKQSHCRDTNQKKKNKSNQIYMGGVNMVHHQQEEDNIISKQERNKIYMKNPGSIAKKQSEIEKSQSLSRSPNALRQISENTANRTPSRLKENQLFTKNRTRVQNNENDDFQRVEQPKKYNRYNVNNSQDFQSSNVDESYKRNIKSKTNTDYSRYRANNTKASKAFDRNNGDRDENYCPSINNMNYEYGGSNNERSDYSQSDRHNYYDESKGLGDNSSKGQGKDHESSLYRIKSEIERSRKLIEEFKKGDNSHY